MTRAFAFFGAAVLFAACGGDDSTANGGDGGNAGDGATNGDGGVGQDGSGGDSAVTPPTATCNAPIQAADVSTPTTVVGAGTAASCTAAALATAVGKGGIVTFDCGGAATIAITATIVVPIDKDTVIDGGGNVTLDGGGAVRILSWQSNNYRANDHVLTLQHMTLANGKATGTKQYPTEPAPCSQGFYDGAGGALDMRDGILHVIDATFTGNQAAPIGPDVGGGAIYISGSKGAVVVGSTFTNNTASNSGAIGALNSELDVYNSTFTGNKALGNGANSDDASKCSVVDPVTMQHQVGSGGNAGAVGIDGGSDGTHTFCGSVFRMNAGGVGALGGAIARTPDGAKMTTNIDRCLFDANTADSAGALYFHNSNLTITASTFSANVGQGNGTIQADGTTIDFTNVTFANDHSAKSVGATISLFSGDGKLTNCTFSGNVCDAANMFGCAVFGGPTLTVQNTIFVGNNGTNPTEPMQCKMTATGGGDVQWPTKKISGGGDDQACVTGIAFADPKLGALMDNGGAVPTMVPAAGSPAIGVGMRCPTTDARGKTRPASGCTAGAAEAP
jgi:hypothetical protein